MSNHFDALYLDKLVEKVTFRIEQENNPVIVVSSDYPSVKGKGFSLDKAVDDLKLNLKHWHKITDRLINKD